MKIDGENIIYEIKLQATELKPIYRTCHRRAPKGNQAHFHNSINRANNV